MYAPAIDAAIFLFAAYGIFFSFRLLRFPDLSVDNVFSFGAMAGAFYWLRFDNLPAALLLTFASAAMIGIFTSLLFSIGRISKLLCGIIVFTMLFSINLKFFDSPSPSLPGRSIATKQSFLVVDLICASAIYLLLKTKLGYSLTVQGANPRLHKENGSPGTLIMAIGMAISSGLIALGGMSWVIYFEFANASVGSGVLVHAASSLLIGELLSSQISLSNGKNFRLHPVIAIAVGAFLYSAMLFFVTTNIPTAYLDTADTKLVAGILLIGLLLANPRKQYELIPLQRQ